MIDAILKIIIHVVPSLFSFLEQRLKRKTVGQNYHAIYRTLLKVLNETSADRVLILYATNAGKSLKDAKEIYSSVEFEVNTKNLLPCREVWQRQKIDNSYKSFLLELIDKKTIITIVDNMSNNMLRNAYESAGIEKNITYKLANEGNIFWYFSISYKDNVILGSKEHDSIRYGLNELQRIFKGKKEI